VKRALPVLAAAALAAVAAARACRPTPLVKESVSFIRPAPPPSPPMVEEPVVEPLPPPPPPVVPPPQRRNVSGTILRPAPAAEAAGTVWGTVTLQGPRPSRKRVRREADPACAARHAEPQLSDELVVGHEGQLRWAVVHVTRGLGDRRFEPPTSPVDLEQIGCRFVPHVVTARAGQPVQFLNRDPFLHCVHGLPFENRGFSFGQHPDTVVERTFGRPEIFAVKSDIRPWMKAWIAVFDHPFSATTDEEGRYRIVGLPPGRYELSVWHESATFEKAEVDVAPDRETSRDFLLQRR
jgi:plastocyanin